MPRNNGFVLGGPVFFFWATSYKRLANIILVHYNAIESHSEQEEVLVVLLYIECVCEGVPLSQLNYVDIMSILEQLPDPFWVL